MRIPWVRWAWAVTAVAALAAGVAMYLYEASQQEEIENMLRAALLEYQAESAQGDGAETASPEGD